MKRIVTFYAAFATCLIAVVIIACQKNGKLTQPDAIKDHPVFSRTVGGPIDSATANSWKRNLEKRLHRNRTTAGTTTVYYLSASLIRSLISPEDATGICFYYGQDSIGNVHLMPISVNNRGSVIRTSTVQTTNGIISWATAVAWHKRFKEYNPNGIWAHFWGMIAVNRLLEQGGEQVRISLGENEQGTRQMMFSSAADSNPSSEGDLTKLCPQNCPSGYEEAN